MEPWLALREAEGLTLRELAERSGVPFGTLASWSRNRRLSDEGGGFVEAKDAGPPGPGDSRRREHAAPVLIWSRDRAARATGRASGGEASRIGN